MFVTMNCFIRMGLGTLIAGARKLHVVFATYKRVPGYPTGPVATGKDGLTIQVQDGNNPAVSGAEEAAQAVVEESLEIEARSDATLLVVIYAGLSAFDQGVDFARKVKEDHPAAKVVILTCDCDLTWKSRKLTPLLENKELDAVVVTDECGGRGAMRDILKAVIASWPVPVRFPA